LERRGVSPSVLPQTRQPADEIRWSVDEAVVASGDDDEPGAAAGRSSAHQFWSDVGLLAPPDGGDRAGQLGRV